MSNITTTAGIGSTGATQLSEEGHSTTAQESGSIGGETSSANQEKRAGVPKKYKSVPQTWTALPEGKFRQVINHLESVLFEISTDGNNINLLDGRISPSTLNRWADHLRSALKALTVGT